MKNFSNIVIRMPNWLGDFVMATATFSDIKKAFPNSKITAICQGQLDQLIIASPYIDAIYKYKKNNGKNLILFLKKEKFDLGILFTNSLSSAWAFFRGGVKERMGFKKDCRSFFLTKSINFPLDIENRHLVDVYKYLLTAIGMNPGSAGPYLHLTQAIKKEALGYLENFSPLGKKRIIGFCPGAAYGEAKCWPIEYFIELVSLIKKETNEYNFIIFGDEQTLEKARQITKEHKEVINLCGKTSLAHLAALIKLCEVFVTNDSGPMHIADALFVNVIALFGSTNPIKTGPYHQKNVLYMSSDCSPCYLRKCPIDFRCMMSLTPETVFKRIKPFIKRELC